ncbi:Hypothetical predicted protein [Lecanosticta acicola]|uniref:Uncharacterized protein n=1 Tax=Lecanosticta acicola TaxID=111012 RepID=A0AAI8Z364_9PEZI|nr:Hypothetical predicted protein [Lecanosticta acicola]
MPIDRDPTTGRFRNPTWLPYDGHPYLNRNTGFWQDPNPPPNVTPARRFDGIFTSNETDRIDRPILHASVQEHAVALSVAEDFSDWTTFVDDFQRQPRLPDFGSQDLLAVIVHPSHAMFFRQLIVSGHAAAVLLHKGLVSKSDAVHRAEGLSERVLFSHHAAIFRQYFAHLQQWPPSEHAVDWQNEPRKCFHDFWQLQAPLTLREGIRGMSKGEKMRIFGAFHAVCGHLGRRYSYDPLERTTPEARKLQYISGDRDPTAEIAWRLQEVFEALCRNPEGWYEPGDRVTLRRHLQQLGLLVELPVIASWKDGTVDNDRKTLHGLMDAVASGKILVPHLALPQTAIGTTRRKAQQVADRDWTRDIADTLQPVVSAIGDVASASEFELMVCDLFTIVWRMESFLANIAVDAEFDERLVADTIHQIELSSQAAWQGPLRDVFSHALKISKGVLGETTGIFTYAPPGE